MKWATIRKNHIQWLLTVSCNNCLVVIWYNAEQKILKIWVNWEWEWITDKWLWNNESERTSRCIYLRSYYKQKASGNRKNIMKLHLSVNFYTLSEILHQKGNQWKTCTMGQKWEKHPLENNCCSLKTKRSLMQQQWISRACFSKTIYFKETLTLVLLRNICENSNQSWPWFSDQSWLIWIN